MNKKELIEFISSSANLTLEESSNALEAFIEAVITTLQNKENVTIVGFGAFSVTEREARIARNPRTGEPIAVPATVLPKFKAGKLLREALKP